MIFKTSKKWLSLLRCIAIGFMSVHLTLISACGSSSANKSNFSIVRVDTDSSFISGGKRSGWHLAPTAAVDKEGIVYIAWTASFEDKTDVLLARSEDGGRSFSHAKVVNDVPGVVAGGNSQVRPVVATGPKREIAVVWADSRSNPRQLEGLDIYCAISKDGGQIFSPSVRVNDDQGMIPQSFSDVALDSNGHIYVVWLDSRTQSDSDQRQRDVHFAKSIDGGKTFRNNANVTATQKHGVCVCCRPDIWVSESGRIFVAFRNAKENIRDIYLSKSEDGGNTFLPPMRVGYNNWELWGCPSDGPAITGFDNQLLVAWMDAQSGAGKIYFTRSKREDKTFEKEAELLPADKDTHRSHPVFAQDSRGDLYLAWEESVNGRMDIALAKSSDGGKTFQPMERHLASEGIRRGSPWLVSGSKSIYLVWSEEKEGGRHIYLARM